MNTGIRTNEKWLAVERTVHEDFLESFINKLSIGGRDCYFRISWHEGRPVAVDLTIGTGADNNGNDLRTNELASAAMKNARASIELICRHASALLQTDVWTLDDLISAWRGTAFDPDGICPELQGLVSSPLDAAARLCDKRQREWRKATGE